MGACLFVGPDAAEWGTGIDDANLTWVGRSSTASDSGGIFVAGPATRHDFELRPIAGAR